MEENTIQSLFMSLVYTFNMTAMQNLGRVSNPMLNKPEVDLEQAKLTIDMLNMLKTKTENNRNEEEEEFISNTISSLELIYIEECKKNT